jgi:hypothetical protein
MALAIEKVSPKQQGVIPMVSITFSELITIIFVLVDDWYQMNRDRLLKGKAGRKPIFSDSEVMTLMMAHDFLPFPSETQ